MYRCEDYGLTPDQYHAGVDKLWDALGLTGTQETDVFTLANARITELQNKLEAMTEQLGEADVENERLQARLDEELGQISLDSAPETG